MFKALWIAYFAIYLLVISGYRIKGFFIRRENKIDGIKYTTKKVKTICTSILKIIKVNMVVTGKENISNEPCLYVCNHQGLLDPLPILSVVNAPVSIISKQELKKLPIISGWLRDMNAPFIDRKNVKEGLKAINQGIDNINNGISMIIFPEGTRNYGKEPGEFKKGSLRLATKTNVPIIPITIDGAHRILEEGKKVTRNTIYLKFHKKIDTSNLTTEEKNNLHIHVQKIIEDGLKEIKN